MALFRGIIYFIVLQAFDFTGIVQVSAVANTEIKNSGERIPRVAIIGGGIGGSATAYFVREILGENAQISVFEKSDRVGGRLATLDFVGQTFESGGSIIHPRNLYMKRFVELLGLQTKTAADGIFSLYDGNHFTFTTSSCSWLTTLKLFWRYGLSLVKMQQATKDLLNKFGNIYTLQENGNVFESVPELLQAMSGNDDFYRLTKISAREYLLEQGISELLINELITAIIKNNYGQSPDVNALTGMVSLAGAEPGLWSVKGGNWKVCKGLLDKSATILNKNTQIIEVIKKFDLTSNSIPQYYLRSTNSLISTPFDVVIVAVPLDVTLDFIGCQGCRNWPVPSELGKFQQTVATFVNGTLNEDTFGGKSQIIGTMEKPDIFFNSIGSVFNVNDKHPKSKAQGYVWKVFSRKPLTNDQKEKLFSHVSETKQVVWLAYPHYTPPDTFLPFVLDEGVFYVNTIEWAASAMEMASLSAKNAALLTARYFNKTKSTLVEESVKVHVEL